MSILLRSVAPLLAFACAGCVASVDFDPVGTGATVEASWTIEGAAASAESCAARSITHVRVRFFDPADAEIFRDHPDLVFACAGGSFDTRPDPVLKSGEWTLRLLALNNDAMLGQDFVVASGPEVLSDTSTGHVVIPPVDFVFP